MKRSVNKAAVAVLVLAAVLIIIGICLAQPNAVFAKAIYICLECVGIG